MSMSPSPRSERVKVFSKPINVPQPKPPGTPVAPLRRPQIAVPRTPGSFKILGSSWRSATRALNTPKLDTTWDGGRLTSFSKKHNVRPRDEGRSRIAKLTIENQQIIIAYPKTYVNRSGAAARSLLNHYQSETPRLIVITDDINLAPGRIRIRRGGGDGGHNGLKSIIDSLHDTAFPRIRIGVGKPTNGDTQIDHVLGQPDEEELAAIQTATNRAAQAIQTIITQGVETAMNEFNSGSA